MYVLLSTVAHSENKDLVYFSLGFAHLVFPQGQNRQWAMHLKKISTKVKEQTQDRLD